MIEAIQVHLKQNDYDRLQAVCKRSHRTPNVATYEAIQFAARCIGQLSSRRYVLRNDEKRLQKDLYFGRGFTLSHLGTENILAMAANETQNSPPPSFYINGDLSEQLDQLVTSGFGTNWPSAIMRALWMYREIVLTLTEEPEAWAFGYITAEDIFKPEQTSDLFLQSAEAATARQDADLIKNEMIGKKTDLDEQQVGSYLRCTDIPNEEKLVWATQVLDERPDLSERIFHLLQTLVLTAAEAADIRQRIDGPQTVVHQREPS